MPEPSFSFPRLAAAEGRLLLTGPQAILKGALEAEMPVASIIGSRSGPFRQVLGLAGNEQTAAVLARHGTSLTSVFSAARAVDLTANISRNGYGAIALIPNDELHEAINAIDRLMGDGLEGDGTACLVLVDDPLRNPVVCPHEVVADLQLPTIEAADVEGLRDAVEQGMRLSRAGSRAAAVVCHTSILQSTDTVTMRPNRVAEPIDLALAKRRRRRVVGGEGGGVLRVARRMELNHVTSMPSPGEEVPIGFITVGPAAAALRHVLHVLHLTGRVPVLHVGLVQPLDPAALERILSRCLQVVVLESRPGIVERGILEVAEQMRRRGQKAATLWGHRIPPSADHDEGIARPDDHLHPSILARNIIHLLHMIRPSLQVATQLSAVDTRVDDHVRSRGVDLDASGAMRFIRRLVADADQWLRERTPKDEEDVPVSCLSLDGTNTGAEAERDVYVEICDAPRFQREGTGMIRHAAREDRPWLIIVCDIGAGDGLDIERLAGGMIPGERTDRVRIRVASCTDRLSMRDEIRQAALLDKLTVLIARDGPPAAFDSVEIERAMANTDRLGFQPVQHMIWPADQSCAIRHSPDEAPILSDMKRLRNEIVVDVLPKRAQRQFGLRVRPLFEQVEVIRTRPPVWGSQPWAGSRPPVPRPIHGNQGQWRAHVAGCRTPVPGAAVMALCEAGRAMGYDVRCLHDSERIGAARCAWAQVLFTRAPDSGTSSPLGAIVPFGEADLLLGYDAEESARACGPDHRLRVAHANRTDAVVNTGWFDDQTNSEVTRAVRRSLEQTLQQHTVADRRLAADFAGACRAWFHSDRLADLAMLGAAFQMGSIPVSLDVMEAAVKSLEPLPFGRSLEAFQFGRRLAIDDRAFSRPRDTRVEHHDRLLRRIELSLSRTRPWGHRRAQRFTSRVRDCLEQMPGLAETDRGREARRDFLLAMYRCLFWGGFPIVERYSELVVRLYLADRGDRGRAATRDAILPLADALLIHDTIYVATMAVSSEQRRRLRHRLNVKRARGDRIVRRFLTRFEVYGFGRRARAEIRSSDWPARLIAASRHVTPSRWRGRRREREIRELVVRFANETIEGLQREYDRYGDAFHRLHRCVVEERLQDMTLTELGLVLDQSGGSTPSSYESEPPVTEP